MSDPSEICTETLLWRAVIARAIEEWLSKPAEKVEGTVLIADDDKDLRDLYARILRTHGFRVLPAADGVEALEVLKAESVDVALIDVMMPRHNGFDVCRIAKSRPETQFTPLLLVTGFNDIGMRMRGMQAGAEGVITELLQSSELITLVRSFVRLKRNREESQIRRRIVFTGA